MARSRVELFEQIRKAHERDELSIHELARRFGTHRRTVRQALASAVPPPRKPAPPRVSPALGPWKPVIDGWLATDIEAPKKQRHTARRVWQRLVEEHDADVGESTVRRYVNQVRVTAGIAVAEVKVPQHHPSARRPRSTSGSCASTSRACSPTDGCSSFDSPRRARGSTGCI